MTKRTNDSTTYTNPRVLIQLMASTIKEVGEDAFTSRSYKVLREGWVAAMYAKAVSKATGKLMYLRPNPKDENPDFFGFRAVDGPDGYKIGENFEIEVFEWNNYSQESLFEALKKKIMKSSAPQTIFVCHAHKSSQEINLSELSKQIIALKPNISELSLVVKFNGNNTYIVARLFPEGGMLFIPNSFSKLFYPKYDFAKKIKALENSDAGLVKINSEMNITEIEE